MQRAEASTNKTKQPYNAVQEAEGRLSKQGKQQTMPGLSPELQGLPLQDAYVLPPLHELGIQSVGGVSASAKYIYKRLMRWINTYRSVLTLAKAKALPRIPGKKWYQAFTMSSGSRPLVEELKDVYVKYNEAQASGDIHTLRIVSTGTALKEAEGRISALPPGANMKWQVQQWHGYPLHPRDQKLVNVRVLETDLKGQRQLGQIIVRFDSDQALTVTQRNKAPIVRTSRVREYWAFERMISDRQSRWKIRERITPYNGGRLPLGLA